MTGTDVQLRPGERNELEMSTVLLRNFIGITDSEFVELTAFVNGKAWIWQCSSVENHIDGLRKAHDLRGYAGSYMLLNGPVNPDLTARYEQGRWLSTQPRQSDWSSLEGMRQQHAQQERRREFNFRNNRPSGPMTGFPPGFEKEK